MKKRFISSVLAGLMVAAASAANAQTDNGGDNALDDYRALLNQLETLNRYNDALGRKIAIQETLIEQRNAEDARIDDLKEGVRALLRDMVSDYGELVESDIPYNMLRRTEQLGRYQNQLSAEDADSNIAQNFRLMLEALQIELDAGRAVAAETQVYLDENGQEVLDNNGEPETIDYLRVGRVAYIRLNERVGVFEAWNQRAREWQPLPDSYKAGVEFGLRVAREQAAPDVMFIPVLPPE